MKKQKFKVEAEIVNGKCPTCDQFTMLVGIEQSFFIFNYKLPVPWCTKHFCHLIFFLIQGSKL